MKQSPKGPLFIFLAALCWSLGGLLIKSIPWNAFAIAGLRSLLAAGVLALYMLRNRNGRIRLSFNLTVIVGAVSLAATTLLFVIANKLTTAANAIVLQYSAPAFIILMGMVCYRQKPRRQDILAVAAAMIGIALFFADRLEGGAMAGNLLALLSGVTFAGIFFVNRMPDAHPETSLLLGHLLCGGVALPFARGITFTDAGAWAALLTLGIVQLGLSYVFFSVGIRNTLPVPASLIAMAEPVMNPLWVFLVAGEKPGTGALLGGALLLVTVVSYNLYILHHPPPDMNRFPDTPG